jgi:hypothetical protein
MDSLQIRKAYRLIFIQQSTDYLILLLPNGILEHPIRRHRLPVPQLIRRLNPKDRYTVFRFRTLGQSVTRRQRMREREVLWQQAQLAESCALIP